ncbi:MAG: phosphotransferase, partial [Anaerolineae bacterium]|nr:phosphotransferase [Anaerolineae bacterium]
MMFEDLDYDSQLERLAAAAQTALAAYGLQGAPLTPVMYLDNAVFRVDTKDASFALRITRHADESRLQSELSWLEAIARDTPLCVPRPVRTGDGALLASVPVAGIDTPVHVSLLSWVEGVTVLPSDITVAQVRQLGEFLAQLHHYAAAFQPSPAFDRPRLDWEGLFGARSPYNPGDGARLFKPDQIAVFDAVAERTRAVMQALGETPATFGLIHADFIAKNYLFQGETVCALDFDHCAYGFYLYDLAPPLLQFSTEARYEALKSALWAGYTSLSPLPDAYRAHLETLVAARHVASCRWIASNLDNPKIRERAPQIIRDRVAE